MVIMSSIADDMNRIETSISPAQNKILLEPFTYICQVPVTDAWTKFANACNYWLKVSPEKCKLIIENSETFNNANLLLDDIQDNAQTRKGIPTAHCTFGIPNTLNSYYYASAISSSNVLELDNNKAVPIYKEQLMDSCRARRMLVYWRDTVTCPSEEEYRQVLARSTCSVVTSTILLLKLFSDFDKDLEKLTRLFGTYIRILEDYERLKSSTDPESKSFAEDITRGNFTFPIIHAINSHPEEGETIMEILRKRSDDVELKKYVLALLERFDSYNYTLKALKQLKEQFIEEAKKIGKNPVLDDLIKTHMSV